MNLDTLAAAIRAAPQSYDDLVYRDGNHWRCRLAPKIILTVSDAARLRGMCETSTAAERKARSVRARAGGS
jgi:hypothetical protein